MAHQKKILIIEDDVDMIEAMKVIFEAKEYLILAAYSPEEGLKKAKEEKPNLIVLDVMFGSKGETKGFDYAVKFKQDRSLAPIPILMITSVNIEHPGFGFSANNGEMLPVDAFIDKPAQPEELVQRAEDLMDKGISKWVNWPDMSE